MQMSSEIGPGSLSRSSHKLPKVGLIERALGQVGPTHLQRTRAVGVGSSVIDGPNPDNDSVVNGKTKWKPLRKEERLIQTQNLGHVQGESAEKKNMMEKKANLLQEQRRELLILIDQLEAIRLHAVDLEFRHARHFKLADSRFRESARNLVHYMALRNMDVRKLQHALADLGLSSLGRVEAHTLASVQAVTRVLRLMLRDLSQQAGNPQGAYESTQSRPLAPSPLELLEVLPPALTFNEGDRQLQRNTEDLLGPRPSRRKTHIMVTLPSTAAEDKGLVLKLLEAGMNVARINCAHDDPSVWEPIVAHVRRCSIQLGLHCRILMDLGGPKLRTGTLETGARIVKLKPPTNPLGLQMGPARVWLAEPTAKPPLHLVENTTHIPILAPKGWLEGLKEGSTITFKDTRGKARKLCITGVVDGKGGSGVWADCEKGAYVQTGTKLFLGEDVDLKKQKKKKDKSRIAVVGELPALESAIVLNKGDTLLLVEGSDPGVPALYDGNGNVKKPARVSCALEEVFKNVKVGEPIKLDDGKIEGVISKVDPSEIAVKITRAALKGAKLRGEKAINLPESNLNIHGLTSKDLIDLDFICNHADMVAFSFVNDATDVAMLQAELKKRDAEELGVVLKIETKKGFEQLPWMLLQGMTSRHPLGVMIARGDMAVECGWERLAEVQEEILWACEAAHVPAIWATQVLEGLAKAGLPSRAEITDAAMGERAECVMLNKGPHVVLAVRTLDDILQRMRLHQTKKQSMLRPLQLSHPFMSVLSTGSSGS